MNRLLITASLLMAMGSAQAMTTLSFEGGICAGNSAGTGGFVACSNGSSINQAYGDAPGVDVSYLNQTGGTASLSFWADAYSGMTSVAYGGIDPQVTLTATGSDAIVLHSFAIGAWPNVNRNSQITVIDLATSNTIFSSGPITILGSAPTLVTLNASSSAGFRIVFGPDGFNVGIDNIAFSVSAIPEPGNAALLATGLLALGALAKRRRVN